MVFGPAKRQGLLGLWSGLLSSLWFGGWSLVATPAELRPGGGILLQEWEEQMSRGFPSMTALLALLAVAGYQNRDKIAEWLNAAQGKAGTLAQPPGRSAGGGLPANLSGMLAGTSLRDLLSGGLRDLVNTFKQAGHGRAPHSSR
jgi:hypothetical protein